MKIACVQMTSGIDPEENLSKLRGFFQKAKQGGCKAIFLPEVYLSKGDGSQQTPHKVSFHNHLFFFSSGNDKRIRSLCFGGQCDL